MATAGDTLPKSQESGNVYLVAVAIGWQCPIVSVEDRHNILTVCLMPGNCACHLSLTCPCFWAVRRCVLCA
jgi:hypothetical protein